MRDVYLSDRRSATRTVTYTARTAYVTRDGDGPKLTMRSGLAQELIRDTQTLSTTNFSDLTYDISGMITQGGTARRRARQISTYELLTQTEAVAEEVNDSIGEVLEEAHNRFQMPLLCVVAALIGYAALMTGTFSRFGVTRQIVGAIFLLVFIKLVESAITDPVRSTPGLWPLVYLPSLVGFAIAAGLLWRAARPFRPERRRKQGVEGAA